MVANDKIIGRSEKYPAIQARDQGLQVVLRKAPEARVQDLSQQLKTIWKARW